MKALLGTEGQGKVLSRWAGSLSRASAYPALHVATTQAFLFVLITVVIHDELQGSGASQSFLSPAPGSKTCWPEGAAPAVLLGPCCPGCSPATLLPGLKHQLKPLFVFT